MDKLMPDAYTIIDFRRETKDNFTLRVNMKTKHLPGQFVQVSLPGIGEAPISICSDSRKYIELNIREVGNVTRALGKLKKGDTLFLRGPYGNGYQMERLKEKGIILIGGGCGIAPLRGVVEYVENHRDHYRDITMLLGYRSPEDIIFNQDIDEWKGKFSITLCVDKLPQGKLCYDLKAGFVTDSLKAMNLSNENCVAFICGPSVMMKTAVDILKEKGFGDSQIFLSEERLMYCAIGVCCHCMIRGEFTCTDGPVFRYDEIKDHKND